MRCLLKGVAVRGSLRLPIHHRFVASISNPLLTPHYGVTYHLKYKVKPSNIDQFTEALRKCWENTTKEPECLYFEVFHSPSEPDTFRLVEMWDKDSEWMEKNHLPRDYYQEYRKAVDPIVLTREFEEYRRLRDWNKVDERYLAGSDKTKNKTK